MMRDEPKNAAELLRYLKVLRSHVEQAEAGKGPGGSEESEQMFRTIFDNAADGMLLADVQSKRLVMGNKVFRQMLACNEEQLINLEIADIHPEESLPYVIEQFEKQARGELTLAKDIPVKREDGSIFYADVNSFPIAWGGKTYLMGIFRDVTEREQAKNALAESEETARAFMNAITDTAVLMDAKLTILDVNKAGAKKLGGSVGDIVGKNVRDLFPAEVFELRRAKAAEVIRTGKTLRYEDERAGMCFDTCICPVFDAQGKAERLAVFARDITAQKQLVQETAMLARFPEESPNPVLRISRDCTILYANAASSPVLATWRIQAGQRLPEACCKRAKEVLSSGKVSTFEFNCDDGRIFLVTLTPVVEEGYLYAYGLDITERKKSQEALRESEQRFSSIFDNAADGILLADVETKKFYMGNKAICQMLGCNQDELKDLGIMDIHPEEDLPYVIQVFEKQARGELGLAKDTPIKRKDGSVFFADINAFPIKLGEKTCLAGVFRDVTERKQAEQALRESEEQFRIIFESAAEGILLLRAEDGKIIDFNEAACENLGYTRAEFQKIAIADVEVIESAEDVADHMQKVSKNRGDTFETKHRAKDGSIREKLVSCGVASIGGQDRVVSVWNDVTEIRQAEEALRQSEQKWRSLAENAPDVIMTVDLDGTILFLNRPVPPLTQEQVIGTSLYDYIPSEYQSTMRSAVEQVVRTGEPCGYELAGTGPEGRISWYESRIGPIKRDDQVIALTLIARDVTEHKQMEETLRQSEELYRSVVEDSPGMLCSFLPDGKITFVNAAYCEYFGKTSEELVGSKFTNLIPEQNGQAVLDNILSLTVDSPSMTHEHRVIASDGRVCWQRWTNRGFFDEQGRAVRFQAFGEDITERRQAEEALQESEVRYRTLFETLPIGVGLATSDGRIIDANGAMLRMMRSSPEELKQVNLPDTYQNPEERSLLLKRLEQDGLVRDFETRLRRRDGTTYFARVDVTPFRLRDETVLVTVARDVTASKQAQEELTQSEQTLRSLINSITESVLLIDTKGTVLAINECCARRVGASIDELMGKSIYDFLPASVKELRRSMFEQVVRTCRPVQFEDRPPGRIVQHSLYPVLDDQGKVERATIFALDVTERRRAEEALAESEEKYKTLVEGASDAIAIIDRNGVFLFVNREVAEQLGSEREHILGKRMWDFFPKEIADRQAANVQKVIDTAQGMIEVALSEMQGQPRWFNTAIRPLRDSNGNVTAAMLIARDVHDMKQAEEQIRKLSSAIEQSIDGIAVADLETRLLYVNEAYARMHGYTPEEMIGMKIASLHSNESMSEYNRAIHQIRTQGSWAGELQHIRKDRTDFPVYLSATLLKDDKGELVGSIGVCRDMTEYKKTQEMMMIKDAAMASSINGIAMGDSEGSLTYVNDSFLEMWGYKDRSEVLGRNAAEFWQAGDEAGVIVEALRRGEGWIGELTAKRKDGSPFDVQVCQTSVTDENGAIISLMASFVDITESKRNQEELSLYREKMAHAEQLASLGSLSATVAHELTQPLTVIRLSLESALGKMEGGCSPDTVTKKLNDSLNQVSNIVALTERFRTFARRSSEHVFREIDLKVVAERIARFLAEGARRASIAVRLEGIDGLPPIYWDERDLEQLFFALVDNAVRAADGKKARQLVISGVVKDKRVELRFSDDCGGIAPESLDRLFEPFFTTRPAGQGTGLGLCIVEEIVSRAGGRIRVESKLGEGSTFIVTLPINEGQRS